MRPAKALMDHVSVKCAADAETSRSQLGPGNEKNDGSQEQFDMIQAVCSVMQQVLDMTFFLHEPCNPNACGLPANVVSYQLWRGHA